jgi:anthranilate phosphoribosyltransferase
MTPPREELDGLSLDQLGGWPAVLGQLTTGSDLDGAQAWAAMSDVLAGQATTAQIAAFVFGLRCKGETVEEMTGLVRAMLDASEPLPVPVDLHSRLIDTCGTGGDRSGTINVSTIAALVVAGAGVPVCKHGGRAASSKAGSADVLEALGVVIDLGPRGVVRCVQEAGIGFCFGPRYHPALRHSIGVRRELGVPTAFNLLGPLANPARVTRQVVGVGDPAMAAKMAGVLAGNGSVHVMIVYGSDGLDELTTTGPSTVLEWKADRVDPPGRCPAEATATETTLDPADLGFGPASPADLVGGDPPTNATLARRVLDGELGPRRDIVVLNAAAGLVVAGAAADLAEGVTLAARSLDEGHARDCLDRLVRTSRESAGH